MYESGTYLAKRWEEVNAAVLLYHLPGEIFAELCYDTDKNEVTDVRSFEGGEQLEDYTLFMDLPEGLDTLEDL